MSSKMQQRIQHARDKGCYVYRFPPEHRRSNRISWGVFVDDEWDFRGPMTKREAKNLAYAISISKHIKLEVSFDGYKN